ncbi:MAG: hypothetical protein J6K81_01790 [Rikenellaceae bacterium]|nr:hypothetical protein [Rikenellaceae bacterium]
MTKHIAAWFVILLTTTLCNAQTREHKRIVTGFSGGVMVHTGWTAGHQPVGSGFRARGMVYGIGGAARLNLGRIFRVGFEGYVSSQPQGRGRGHDPGSVLRTGWGGLLADAHLRFGRVAPYVGVTLVGGSHSTLLFRGEDDGRQAGVALLARGPFLGLDPFVGCDVHLTNFLTLTFKVDCLQGWGIGKSSGTRLPTGPRLYIGVMFSR